MIASVPLNKVHKAAKKVLPRSKSKLIDTARSQNRENLFEKAATLGALWIV